MRYPLRHGGKSDHRNLHSGDVLAEIDTADREFWATEDDGNVPVRAEEIAELPEDTPAAVMIRCSSWTTTRCRVGWAPKASSCGRAAQWEVASSPSTC